MKSWNSSAIGPQLAGVAGVVPFRFTLLLIVGALMATAPAAAYDNWFTHRWLTEQAAQLLIAEEPTRYAELSAHVQEVADGASDENDPLLDGDDDPLTLRVHRHFFRPTDGAGLSWWGYQFPSSFEWGVIENGTNEWDWVDGIAAYRTGDKARAYRTLGHVVHLVEDLSVPAHTHLDIHGPPGGDSYENYCAGKMEDARTSTLPGLPAGRFRNFLRQSIRPRGQAIATKPIPTALQWPPCLHAIWCRWQ